MTAPRPTAEKLAEYEAKFATTGQPEFLQGVSVVGDFMSEQMGAMGFTEDQKEDLCFTLGRLCMGRDPWDAFDLMWPRVLADHETVEQRKTYGTTAVEQNVPESTSLFSDYLGQVQSFCGEEGIFPQPLLWKDTEGKVTMAAIAADGNMCLKQAVEAFATGTVQEMVFGLDRSASPGQGLEFNDFVTMVWFTNGEFYTAVIDYKPAAEEADQIIRDPNWDNNWWNNAMRATLVPQLRKALGAVAA